MHLPDCCCDVCSVTAPAPVDNRPGLPAVAFRHGTFSQVRAALLEKVGLDPALLRLSTRSSDDHIVATVELWAVVHEVIDFHGERYLNECYLGTATQERSVHRLAALVGYQPRPGVAAVAWLSFVVEDGTEVLIPAGLPVQSVPGPATDPGPPPPPVTYETLHDLPAAAVWNGVTAYTSSGPYPAFAPGSTTAVLDRATAPDLARHLHPGDLVVLWSDGEALTEDKTIERVDVQPDRIVVRWSSPVAGSAGDDPQAAKADRILRLFGTGAPAQYMTASQDGSSVGGIKWTLQDNGDFLIEHGTLYLDGKVQGLAVGDSLLIDEPGTGAHQVAVTGVTATTYSVGPLTGEVTEVDYDAWFLDGVAVWPAYDLRQMRVLALAPVDLQFWGADHAGQPLSEQVFVPVWSSALPDGRAGVEVGRTLQGGKWTPGQQLDVAAVDPGRRLLVSWSGPPEAGPPAPLTATFASQPQLPDFDEEGFGMMVLNLALDGPLTDGWAAETQSVRISGNVVAASHGQSVFETLGNGDGTRPFQRFAVARKPVTFLTSAAPGGLVSTLTVAVDGVDRPVAPTLYGRSGRLPVVSAPRLPDGTTVVQGGNGDDMAARFTSGVGNVTARYRTGSGLAGRVGPGALTTLLHHPVGVRSVSNPLPAEGGADPERLGLARSNAPASVRTLGRIVSLRDVEDLVLSMGVVDKAQAVWLWNRGDRLIYVTVAAPLAAPLSTDLRTTIAGALDGARDTSHRLAVDDRTLVPVTAALSVVVDRRADRPGDVVADVDAAVRTFLGFDQVGLGRPLALSDLIGTAAAVPLVVAIEVSSFGYAAAAGFTASELAARGVEYAADGSVAAVQPRLRFYAGRMGPAPGQLLPAELPTVNASSDVTVVDGGRA